MWCKWSTLGTNQPKPQIKCLFEASTAQTRGHRQQVTDFQQTRFENTQEKNKKSSNKNRTLIPSLHNTSFTSVHFIPTAQRPAAEHPRAGGRLGGCPSRSPEAAEGQRGPAMSPPPPPHSAVRGPPSAAGRGRTRPNPAERGRVHPSPAERGRTRGPPPPATHRRLPRLDLPPRPAAAISRELGASSREASGPRRRTDGTRRAA